MGACAGKFPGTPKKFVPEKLSLEMNKQYSAVSMHPFPSESLDQWQRILEQFEETTNKEFLLNAYFLMMTKRLESQQKAVELLSTMLPIVINQRRSGLRTSRRKALYKRNRGSSRVQVNTAAQIAVELALLKILNSPSITTTNVNLNRYLETISGH